MKIFDRRGLKRLALLAAPAALAAALPAPAAAIPVFDATNYSQNILQAARALEQINNQVKSLQNEATMIENMAINLKRIDFPELKQLSGSLQQVDRLMGQAKAIGFKVDRLDDEFSSLFPEPDRAVSGGTRLAEAKARLKAAMDQFKHSMTVQAEVVSNIQADSALLGDIARKSEQAEGGLQAQQATNQILALSTKQQLQLQELLAAQFRSEETERARRAQGEAEAREATRRFLGSGKAYTPPGN